MTTFLLIRHGHTALVGKALAGRRTDIPIDETGKGQATGLVQRLRNVPIHAIYSSPLKRARETAGPLAEARQLETVQRERLAEIDFGSWTGRSFVDLKNDSQWNRFIGFRSSTRTPDGESILDIQLRMVAELESLRSAHPDQTLALFCHGELIRSTLAHYAGIPIDLSLRLEVSPASISVLMLGESGVRIQTINNTTSLLE